mmetsp:Transcript_29059/g.84011  ORF Transcript_29059/g.84011 Transcript_29059/m.84011 type:complete len:125 (+) Transcript_29059:1053-1427(+)
MYMYVCTDILYVPIAFIARMYVKRSKKEPRQQGKTYTQHTPWHAAHTTQHTTRHTACAKVVYRYVCMVRTHQPHHSQICTYVCVCVFVCVSVCVLPPVVHIGVVDTSFFQYLTFLVCILRACAW